MSLDLSYWKYKIVDAIFKSLQLLGSELLASGRNWYVFERLSLGWRVSTLVRKWCLHAYNLFSTLWKVWIAPPKIQ